ncbi:MAG: hypothetical protein QOE05_1278 [Actinomycetota bacterium]|nr:hypothetical protein [Actinomycetota bacterium]
MTRLLATAAAGLALAAGPVHAAPRILICVYPYNGSPVKVCDAGNQPLCVYGYVGDAVFTTTYC